MEGLVNRSTLPHLGSNVALLIGFLAAIAATAVVVAYVQHDGTMASGSSDEWGDLIGI